MERSLDATFFCTSQTTGIHEEVRQLLWWRAATPQEDVESWVFVWLVAGVVGVLTHPTPVASVAHRYSGRLSSVRWRVRSPGATPAKIWHRQLGWFIATTLYSVPSVNPGSLTRPNFFPNKTKELAIVIFFQLGLRVLCQLAQSHNPLVCGDVRTLLTWVVLLV